EDSDPRAAKGDPAWTAARRAMASLFAGDRSDWTREQWSEAMYFAGYISARTLGYVLDDHQAGLLPELPRHPEQNGHADRFRGSSWIRNPFFLAGEARGVSDSLITGGDPVSRYGGASPIALGIRTPWGPRRLWGRLAPLALGYGAVFDPVMIHQGVDSGPGRFAIGGEERLALQERRVDRVELIGLPVRTVGLEDWPPVDLPVRGDRIPPRVSLERAGLAYSPLQRGLLMEVVRAPRSVHGTSEGDTARTRIATR